MSTTLPFPSDRFLPNPQYKPCLPSVFTPSHSNVHVPATQSAFELCDFKFLPGTASTPSPSSAISGPKAGSRRRDPNHVPRPLNCFFLFKADWLAKRKSVLAGIEQDHRQLNRMASSEWRKLSQEAKQRFRDAAHRAKVEHATKYPEYRFTPRPRGDKRRRKTRRNEPEVLLRNEEAARLVSQGITGDALLEALADYDRRAAMEQHPIFQAAYPPPFSEGPPSIASASSSVNPPSPSVDTYSSPDLVVKPTPALLDLEFLSGTFAGGSHPESWLGLPQHVPVVHDVQAIQAEPARDSHSHYFDYFLPGDSTSQISQPRGLENDWSYRSAFPISATQETVPAPASFSLQPSSGLAQSTHTALPTDISEDCWNIASLQQGQFPSNGFSNSLNFTFMCTSGASGGACLVPDGSRAPFLPMESTYYRPGFPNDLDLDPTIFTS